jgi:hypothetical protein
MREWILDNAAPLALIGMAVYMIASVKLAWWIYKRRQKTRR